MNIQQAIQSKQKTIVDVREPWEFAEGHLPNTINIPLNSIIANPQQFLKTPQPIVVYCRSGNRSQHAMLFLQANGIKEVYNGGSLYELQSLMELT